MFWIVDNGSSHRGQAAINRMCKAWPTATLARVSDADRERVARWLHVAVTEGRLTLDEYDERVRGAYAARRFADLEPLIVDLPVPERATLATPP